jgi:dihydrolipoamide dehydrogenase
MERKVEVAVIGAGSAGLFALGQVRKATDNFVLINGGPFGTTCARVGCMPSKVLIQAAEDFHRRDALAEQGISGGDALSVDIGKTLAHVRRLRDGFVSRLTSRSTDRMGDKLITGFARFVEPTVLEVTGQTVRAEKVIIATGSRPVVPRAWEAFGDRILTTDSLFEQESLPPSLAVIGLGVIGLEMGQALHRLGIQVTGIDMLETIGGLSDPAVNAAAVKVIGEEFPLWLGHAAEIADAGNQIKVSAGENIALVDKLLVSMGRRPNTDGLGLETIDAPLDERGRPLFDPRTLQLGDLPIFIAGDAIGERMILHEAGDEGRIAGSNAVRDVPLAYRRKTPLAVTFSDPNIASVGASWQELEGRDGVAVGEYDMANQNRAAIMGRNRGLLRIYGDAKDGRLLGAAMLAPRAEHLGHLLAWCIEKEMTVFDLIRMPFYHPVIEEGLQNALYDLARHVENRPEGVPELTLA